ncbi:5-oxoprolinase subunit PxpA [Maritalea porphyrae]|uniref:UPF0271 protein n=1 Tax=Maritalea porphyrae TaxID=880732 RepID=A0ABQ5UV26_9HYPH|nr:5-oxoprolinase subunit PxpA [Maritalea porphyrae]GLQ18413.1 UPF0271 protein [Maritalea porphyrae]
MRWIDLNADLGEGTGNDPQMMNYVSSANIACGGHAGDDETIQRSISLALENDVAIGAHPGFEDKEHFGRRQLELSADELQDQIVRQLERFEHWAQKAGTSPSYVKLHGALANMTAADRDLAENAYRAVKSVRSDMPILTIANSKQVDAATNLGLPVIAEAFADRAYTDEGLLASRSIEGAVLTKDKDVVSHVEQLLTSGTVTTISGNQINLPAQSLCLHGDNEHAVQLAKRIRETIEQLGIIVKSFANE